MTRPTVLASALAATTVLLAAGAAPGSAAAADDGAPAWTSAFEVEDPADTTQWLGGSVVDPATGDVLTLVHNSDHPLKRRLRRVDGTTGQTRWETGLEGPVGSYDLMLALDPGGKRAVVAIDEPSRVFLHSVDLDGTVGWSKVVEKRGGLEDLVVDPTTGRACHTTAEQPHRSESGSPEWRLTCTDRAGEVVVDTLSKVGGAKAAGLGALAVDPERGRWYVAGTQRTKRGSRSIVIAIDGDGTRTWRRSVDHPTGGLADAAALVVDPRSHRVYLGGSSEQVRERANGSRSRLDRAHLVAWRANGTQHFRRTWTDGRRGAAVTDLALAGGSGRIAAVTQGRSGGLDLRVMNAKGRLVHRVRQEVRGEDGRGHVALDRKRRVVVVTGSRVVAYDWKGRRLWRSPSDDYFAMDLDHDPVRGRIVVSWMSDDDPGASEAWVSAWTL